MPKSAPTLRWVVETGRPRPEARITRRAVARLALKPWPSFISVIRWLMVSATRFAPSRPPRAMTAAVDRDHPGRPGRFAATRRATILGVSLRPRAKLTAPADTKWSDTRARCADIPRTWPV